MPDILQILSDYFSKKVDGAAEGIFKIRIPQDLIEHILKFYLSPYLSEMEVKFYERSLEIRGTNILPVSMNLKISGLKWDKEEKFVAFEIDVSDLVYKFIRGPLQSLRDMTKGVISEEEGKIYIDFEKLSNLKPQWNGITYALRNKVKLTDIRFKESFLELVFEKVKP
jgi:hypothetical protein